MEYDQNQHKVLTSPQIQATNEFVVAPWNVQENANVI